MTSLGQDLRCGTPALSAAAEQFAELFDHLTMWSLSASIANAGIRARLVAASQPDGAVIPLAANTSIQLEPHRDGRCHDKRSQCAVYNPPVLRLFDTSSQFAPG